MIKYFALLLPITFILTACSSSKTDLEKQWIYINNGSLQCQTTGKSLKQTAAQLIENDILVENSKCAHLTGVMVASMCGMPTLEINLHLIDKAQLEKSQTLGFIPAETLKDGDDLGYQVNECRTNSNHSK